MGELATAHETEAFTKLGIEPSFAELSRFVQQHEEGKGRYVHDYIGALATATPKSVMNHIVVPDPVAGAVIPGTLQRPGYIDAQFRGLYPRERAIQETYKFIRLATGTLLRQAGVTTNYIIAQEALTPPDWADQETMRDQLKFLAQMAASPKATLQILPERTPEDSDKYPDFTLFYTNGVEKKDEPPHSFIYMCNRFVSLDVMIPREDIWAFEAMWDEARGDAQDEATSLQTIQDALQAVS